MAFVLSACGSGTPSPASTPSNTSSQETQNTSTTVPSLPATPTNAAAQSTAGGQAALQLIADAYKKLMDKPYRQRSRAEGTISGKVGGQEIKSQWTSDQITEFQSRDRFHTVDTYTTLGGPAATIEGYAIGDTLYIKGPDGSWQRSKGTSETVQDSATPRVPDGAKLIDKLQDVREVGLDISGGMPARVFTAKLAAKADEPETSFKVCIGNDGLPQQLYTEVSGTASAGGNPLSFTGSQTTTYEQDPTIKIEPPTE